MASDRYLLTLILVTYVGKKLRAAVFPEADRKRTQKVFLRHPIIKIANFQLFY